MKIKKKAAFAAAVFAAAMNLSACAYGPPPESDFPDGGSGEVYNTPTDNDFDPGDNYAEVSYSHPDEEWEDETTGESETENISDNTEDENTGDDIQ